MSTIDVGEWWFTLIASSRTNRESKLQSRTELRTNHHKAAHYQDITLVLSWNWWMTNARTVSQPPTAMILHRTVEPILNRTLSRMIHKVSQNLSDDIL